MQIQCAPACGLAIAWHPVVRELCGMTIEIDEIEALSSPCNGKQDLLAIAEVSPLLALHRTCCQLDLETKVLSRFCTCR